MRKKLQRNFVSELDIFLAQFDKNNEQLSESQLQEIRKHQRLAKLRDEAQHVEGESRLWEGF